MDINSITRRQVIWGAVATLFSASTFAQDPSKPATATSSAFAELERKSGGRLGVTLLDTATGMQTGLRVNERFAMCSTFKLPLAAVILREADQGRLRLDQFVPFTQKDMVPHAPITKQHLAKGGMTVRALANAAQLESDNTAANLLLSLIGGPAGFTSILRTLGDATTRLDRTEPSMNLVTPGDVRDTTTPAAMSQTIARMLTGQWLQPVSRDLLISWMIATETGRKRLRAGFPTAWRSGDKTGTGSGPNMLDKYNDIAIVWPTGKAPVIVSAFYETAVAHGKMRDEDQAVLASVGRVATEWSRQLA